MNNGITGGQGFVTELFVTERPLTQDEAEALESAGTPKRPDPASQPCGNDAYSRLKPGQTCRDCYGRLFVRLDYDKCRSDWALVTDVPDKGGFDSQDLSPPRPPNALPPPEALASTAARPASAATRLTTMKMSAWM